MPSVNKIILVGNLGRDPDVRITPSGDKVVVLSIATSEHWKDRVSGEHKERVEWHRAVVFHHYWCDVCERLKKGDAVFFEGQLQTRKWQDAQGQERRTKEAVCRYEGRAFGLSTGRSGGGFHGEDAGVSGGNRSRHDAGTGSHDDHARAGGAAASGEAVELDDDEIPY